MSLAVWASGTESIEILRSQLPASSVNLLTQDIDELLEFASEQTDPIVIFDFAGDKKNAQKFSKKLQKQSPEIQIFFLCDGLSQKEIVKHQKSKAAVNGYLTHPISPSIIQVLLGVDGAQIKGPDQVAIKSMDPKELAMIQEHGLEDKAMPDQELSDSIQKSFDEVSPPPSASSMFDTMDDSSLDLDEDSLSDDVGDAADDDLSLGDEALSLDESQDLDLSTDDSLDLGASDDLSLGEDDSLDINEESDLSLTEEDDLSLGDEYLGEGLEESLGDDLDVDLSDELSSDIGEELSLGEDEDFSLDAGDGLSLDGDDELLTDDLSLDEQTFDDPLDPQDIQDTQDDQEMDMNEEILEAMNDMDGEDLSLFSQKLEELGLLQEFDPKSNENYSLINASFNAVFDETQNLFEHIEKIHKEKAMSDDELTLEGSDDLNLELGDGSDSEQGNEEVALEDDSLDLSLDADDSGLELGGGEEAVSLDDDGGGLDLDLGGELDLNAADDTVSLEDDEGGLDLNLSDDEGLDLGGDDLSLPQEAPEDALADASLELDTDSELDLGLGSGDEVSLDEELDFSSGGEQEAASEALSTDDDMLVVDEESVDLDFGSSIEEEDDSSGLSQEKTGLEDLGFSLDDSLLPDESPEINLDEEPEALDQGLELSNDMASDLDDSPMQELAEFKPQQENESSGSEPNVEFGGELGGELDGDVADKLAEIDAMMASDESSPVMATEDKTGEIELPDGLEQTQSSEVDLNQVAATPLSNGDEHEPQTLQEAPYNSNRTSTHVRNQMAEIDQLIDGKDAPSSNAAPSGEITQVNMQVPQSSVNLEDLKSQNQIVAFHNEELAKLAATINALRDEREYLIKKIENLEEGSLEDKRNSNAIKAELDEKKIELSLVKKRFNQQFEESQYRVNLEQEKKRIFEEKNRAIQNELSKLQQKVKVDFKKIQHREKELESQLELLRADSEIQLKNRDEKILELKRKIDSLEFEVDALAAQEKVSKEENVEVEERMEMVMKTLRSAITILEEDEIDLRSFKNLKKNLDV